MGGGVAAGALAAAGAWFARGGHLVALPPPQSALDPAGPVAAAQLWLLKLSLGIMIGVFAVVVGVLLVSVIRFRERPGMPLPRQVEGNTRLEIIWTVGPFILLCILAVPTVREAFALSGPAHGGNPLTIDVVGHQYWWEFKYPQQGIVTASEMHIPVGRKVTLVLTSADVIHSFWVPRLAGKTDLIPDRTNYMWLEADKPGVYLGQCAQYCGESHANMRFRVIVDTPQQFAAWVAAMKRPAPQPQTALAQEGMQVFAQSCSGCHTIDGTPFVGKIGPNLTALGLRQTIASGDLANTPANLAAWLRNPPAVQPGTEMPNLHLGADKIRALVAYLEQLR